MKRGPINEVGEGSIHRAPYKPYLPLAVLAYQGDDFTENGVIIQVVPEKCA